MPPSTTMAKIRADSMKVNDSGFTMPWRAAKNAPPKPANMAPSVKAESLIFMGFRPSERQAISSSRSASQARPMGIRIRRLEIHSVSTARARAIRYKKITMCMELNSRPRNWWKVGGTLRWKGCVPAPGRTRWAWECPRCHRARLSSLCRFTSSRRMISPKPSVTMAR